MAFYKRKTGFYKAKTWYFLSDFILSKILKFLTLAFKVALLFQKSWQRFSTAKKEEQAVSAKIGARKLGQGFRIIPENQTMQKVKQFEIYLVSQEGSVNRSNFSREKVHTFAL